MAEVNDVLQDQGFEPIAPMPTNLPGMPVDGPISGRTQANGRIVKEATVDGIAVLVVVESKSKGGGVVTGFPTNVSRNPL
jgi:hypothetical protein